VVHLATGSNAYSHTLGNSLVIPITIAISNDDLDPLCRSKHNPVISPDYPSFSACHRIATSQRRWD
jgi:poly(A) polymerase Pap1